MSRFGTPSRHCDPRYGDFASPELTEMIEVKQGPYAGEADKTRFSVITADQARIRSGDDC